MAFAFYSQMMQLESWQDKATEEGRGDKEKNEQRQ